VRPVIVHTAANGAVPRGWQNVQPAMRSPASKDPAAFNAALQRNVHVKPGQVAVATTSGSSVDIAAAVHQQAPNWRASDSRPQRFSMPLDHVNAANRDKAEQAPQIKFPSRGIGEHTPREQEEGGGRSPGGSIVSSITTLNFTTLAELQGANAGVPTQPEVDAINARVLGVDDALARLTKRLTTAESTLKSDLPAMKFEGESQRSTLTTVSAKQKYLIAQVEALELRTIEERAARAENEKALNKELREHVAVELDRIRDSLVREMKERMDGQKVIREEVQLQQASLMSLTSRMDESLVELRTELPRLSQDVRVLKGDTEKVQEWQAQFAERLAALDRSSTEQSSALRQEIHVVKDELRQNLISEAERLAGQTVELQKVVDSHKLGLDSTTSELKVACAFADELAEKSRVHTESLDTMHKQLLENQTKAEDEIQQAKERWTSQLTVTSEQVDSFQASTDQRFSSLDSDLRDTIEAQSGQSETSFQSYVEAVAIGRISSLESSLRQEMSDRNAAQQQVLEKITHNSERWSQMQLKFDELLIEVVRAPSSSVGGADTGVGTTVMPKSPSKGGLF